MRNLSELIVDPYGGASLSARARAKRWTTFGRYFPALTEMNVIDLGGDIRSWRSAPVRPAHLLMVNTLPQDVPEQWAEAVVADACELPATIRRRHFDLVFSNSVIEHVGGHERRARFAEAASALSDRLWVQTPYRYFPVEPHWLFPGFQFLPVHARTRIMRHWPIGTYPTGLPYEIAVKHVLNVELLSATELAWYFPDAAIWRERLFGVTKSLVAVKP